MVAKEIVRKDSKGQDGAAYLSANLANMIFYVIADATVGIPKSSGPVCEFEDFQFLGETARTDKQLGASAKSSGSTSLVEKPGFPELLGFAVERGAIKQSVDGTTLTLSTTPYALVAAANRKDTAQLYQQASLLNRLAVSASFNISNQDMLLANASRSQLTEWSAKVRLSGDRSSRSKAFIEFWQDNIQQKISDRNLVDNAEGVIITNNNDRLRVLFRGMRDRQDPQSLISKVDAYLKAHKSDADTGKKVQDIKNTIYCELRKVIYDAVVADPTLVNAEQRTKIKSVLDDLQSTSAAIKVASAQLNEFFKTLQARPESTFEYTNHRDPMASDYSELKLLYRMDTEPLKLTLNAGVSLYNNPNRLLNQERVRDFSIALSFEGEAKSPFAQTNDLSKITYSFNGSYERLKENEGMTMRKPNIASVQFRLEFPIALGLSIPVAYTYSNNTEMMMMKENKFNVGLHLDIDKLYAIARGAKK
jgi:hypothetical protein